VEAVYFTDGAGQSFAVKQESWPIIWSHKISETDASPELYHVSAPMSGWEQVIIRRHF